MDSLCNPGNQVYTTDNGGSTGNNIPSFDGNDDHSAGDGCAEELIFQSSDEDSRLRQLEDYLLRDDDGVAGTPPQEEYPTGDEVEAYLDSGMSFASIYNHLQDHNHGSTGGSAESGVQPHPTTEMAAMINDFCPHHADNYEPEVHHGGRDEPQTANDDGGWDMLDLDALFNVPADPPAAGDRDEVAAVHAILENMYTSLYNNRLHLPAGDGCGEELMPVGSVFQPSDEELITDFLMPELLGSPTARARVVVSHVDIYAHHPDQLQQLAMAHSSVPKMYFFTPVSKTKRRTTRRIKSQEGCFWKATQSFKPIHDPSGNIIGCKTSITYMHNNHKTPWLMSEYAMPHPSSHLLVLAVVYQHRPQRTNDD